MPKRRLTKEEQLALDLRKYENLISNPVFRSAPGTSTRMGNLNVQPQNAAAVARMIRDNPELNAGLLSPINEGGLINNANTELSTTAIKPSMQTNPQTPTQQPSNIFGDAMTTIFPGINQDNKQLINAAILRGSLELLKPRQPSEGLAGQFGRAIDAGQKVGTDLQKQGLENLVAQFGIQKDAAQIQKLQKDIGASKSTIPTKEQSRIYKSSIDSLIDIDKDFSADIDTIRQKSGDFVSFDDETKDLLALAAIEIGGNPTEALKKAAKRLATKQLSINNQNQEPTQTGVDKFADKNIKIKK
tara:strand:+ start:1344 stop:2246 length:903 start_codon:yes stop_codon:yes gene_type:complete